jgi:hypothetical protein
MTAVYAYRGADHGRSIDFRAGDRLEIGWADADNPTAFRRVYYLGFNGNCSPQKPDPIGRRFGDGMTVVVAVRCHETALHQPNSN